LCGRLGLLLVVAEMGLIFDWMEGAGALGVIELGLGVGLVMGDGAIYMVGILK
jgi:hypothetical protein